MRLTRPAVAFVALAALLSTLLYPGASEAQPRDPRLVPVRTFAFALGLEVTEADVAALAPYDLVVLDGEAEPGAVAALRSQGAIVLGYLSVGTIEPYRPWYGKLKRFRLSDRFEEFDEDYARVAAGGFRRAIAGRIAPRLLDSGFDGLFLDNTDMVETHPKQRRGMRRLVRRLASLVDGRGGLLFTQNGESEIGPMLAVLDGWNREDVTSTYSFKRRRYVRRPPGSVAEAQAELARVAAAGLLVTATDYTAAGDSATDAEAVANACGVGAIPFVSDIGLTRIPPQPFRCGP